MVPQNGSTKFLFFSGKGGVGKSTMSCATAAWLATNGYKTLLVTTDPVTKFAKEIRNIYDLLTPVNGTRYIFFTGKGGVGKSTVACITSQYLAEQGFKTLIVTTDPASHLHDIFGQTVRPAPGKILPANNLFAARIDQKTALQEYKKRIVQMSPKVWKASKSQEKFFLMDYIENCVNVKGFSKK